MLGQAGEGDYAIAVGDGGCGDRSVPYHVSYDVSGTITTPVLNLTNGGVLCTGNTVVISLKNYEDYSNVTYQLYQEGASLGSSATLTSYEASSTCTYRLVVVKGTCSTSKDTLITAGSSSSVTKPVITAVNNISTICGVDGGVTLSLDNSTIYSSATTYQWYRNDTLLTGENAITISIKGQQAKGDYKLAVSDAGCGDVSMPFSVDYDDDAQSTIAAPELHVTNNGQLCTGNTVVISLKNYADYPNATYQWYKDGVIQTGATLTSYEAAATGTYRIEISDGSCQTWETATVTTGSSSSVTKPVIAAVNNISTICGPNGGVTLSLDNSTTYSGAATYQWYRNDTLLTGETAITISVKGPLAEGDYKLSVSDGGCSDVSDAFPVDYNPAGTITAADLYMANNGELCTGNTVVISLKNYAAYPNATYQWYQDDVEIPGETAPSYGAAATGTYRLDIVMGACGTSGEADVTTGSGGAITQPQINTTNGSFEICGPEGGVTLALGNPGDYTGSTLTYEWHRNNTLLLTAHDSTLSVTGQAGAGTYRLYVSNGSCGEWSAPFEVTYDPLGTVTRPRVLVANGGVICSPNAVGLWLENYADYSATATYQWFKNGVEIPGATLVSYETNEEGRYRIEVADGNCTSSSAEDTLKFNISGGTIPTPELMSTSDPVICGENGSVTLKLANSGDFVGATFKWTHNDSLLLSHTQPTLTVNVPGTYKVNVTLNGCTAPSSNTIYVDITSSSSIAVPAVAVGNSGKICETGGEAALWLTNVGAYTNPAFQWYKNNAPITGENQASLRIVYDPNANGNYTVEVIDVLNGCSVMSAKKEITLQPGGTAVKPDLVKLAGEKICGQDGSVTLGFTNSAFDATTDYVWFKNGIVIDGAKLPTLTVTEQNNYKAYVTHNGCGAYSDVIFVPEDAGVSIEKPVIMANSSEFCETGGSVALWVTNVNTSTTYQWFRGGDRIDNATGGNYAVTREGTYTVVAVDTVSNCSAVSGEEFITMKPGAVATTPQLIATGKNGAVICGDIGLVTLKLGNSADYDGSETYVWFFNGNVIYGFTGAELVVTDHDSAGIYKVYVTFNNCTAFSEVSVTAVDDTAPPTITCAGGGSPLVRNTDTDVCTYKVTGNEFYPTDTSDNCTIISVLHDYHGSGTNLTDSLFPLGETIVTWTITDGSGHTAICTDTIRIIDRQRPNAICYPDTVYLDAGDRTLNREGAGTITAQQVGRNSYDNADACVTDNLFFNFGPAGSGISELYYNCSHIGQGQPVQLTVTDSSGNIATCSTQITVLDIIPPDLSISCPGDTTLYIDPADYTCHIPLHSGLDLVMPPYDNCGYGNIRSVVWTMTGATTHSSGSTGLNETIGSYTFNVGTTTVTYYATDFNISNPGTCSFAVIVLDTIKPTVTAISDTVFYSNDGCDRLEETLIDDVAIEDNCPAGLKMRWRSVHSDGTVISGSDTASLKAYRYPKGSSTLTVIAEDLSGNKDSASIVVNVYDVTPPVLTIPPELVTVKVACADDPIITAPDASAFILTDNCAATATIQINHLSDYVDPADSVDRFHFIIQRKWQAYDAAAADDVNLGNGQYSQEKIQYIIVNDTVPPVFADDPNRLQPVISCDNYDADIAAMEALVPVFTNNCGEPDPVPEIVQRDTVRNNGRIFIRRTWVARDSSGNASDPFVQEIELPSNDLAVTITASPTEGYYGDQIDFVITVTNNSPTCEVNATAISKLPPELHYLSHNPAAAAYNAATGHWSVGALAPQASKVLTVKARIVDTLENHPVWVAAHVDIKDPLDGSITIPEVDDTNNDDIVYINSKGYAIKIEKWAEPGAATIGDLVTFIIRVTSRVNTDNDTLWVRDVLPAGLEFVELPHGGQYIPASHEVKVQLLPPHSSRRDVTVVARVTDAAGDTVINYAEVYRHNMPHVILDTAVASLFTTKPDLTVTASVIDAKESTGSKSYMVDREYTFQAKYANIGALPVKQATLTATFNPKQVQVRYVNNSGVIGDGKVTWQLANIAKADPERSVEMRVEPLLPGNAVTTFCIDTQEPEAPKDNNCDVIEVDQHIWIIQNVLTDYGENTVLHIPQLNDPKYHVARARLTVVNVWGNMVYRNADYKGITDEEKFSGRNLSKGTYYYELIVEFDDGTTTTMKHWVMILR